MAIPRLYWMLECTACGSRRVVYDSYLKFVGTSEPNPKDGAGYEGPPLTDRYTCTKGCTGPMNPIGSMDRPEALTMWLYEPHERVVLTEEQSTEWRQLIQEAGLTGGGSFNK